MAVVVAFFVASQQKKKKKGNGSVVAIAFFGAPLQPKNKKEGDSNCRHLLWFVVAKKKKKNDNNNEPNAFRLWCSYSPLALVCSPLAPLFHLLVVLLFGLFVLTFQRLLSFGDGMSAKSTRR